MPITKALMEARSGIARAAATRSDYYRPFPVVTIGGTVRTDKVDKGTLQIVKQLTQQSDTARMDVFGFDPIQGQQVIVASGQIGNRVFGGTVQRVKQQSVRGAAIKRYTIDCIDWTWLLNRRRVTTQYAAGQPANLIVADLVTRLSTGFSVARIKPGAPATTSVTTFRGDLLSSAITKVADAAGWHWHVDADQRVHFYDTEASQSPQAITTTNYLYDLLEYQLDLSQVRTRFYGVGGGGQTTAPAAAGATTISVNESGWYAGGGGLVISGANIITYTGVSASSGPGDLTGCSGVLYDILQGDTVNVFVQVDDAGAQAALAALEGGDGIHEGWVENGDWSLATTTTQATAALAAFKNTDIRGTYFTYDKVTEPGKTLTITLPARSISTTVTLQKVTRFLKAPDRWGFTVEFSVVWSDLVDVLLREVH
jgi:hypothetical protein